VKSLRERWFSIGGKKNDSKAESCGPMLIERDVVVSLPLKQPGGNKRKKTGEQQVLETADYIIMGVYTKAYNKWFLSDQKDSPIWQPNLKTSKHKLALRMVSFDAGYGMYQLTPVGEGVNTQQAYVMEWLHNISAVIGRK
jgi:hypothetical protein